MKLSFEEIQGIDSQCNDSFEQLNRSQKICQLDKVQRETQAGQQQACLDDLSMRSFKKIQVKCQISFQNNFMHEHSTSFKEQLQNYIEFVGKWFNKQNLNHSFPSLSENPVNVSLPQILKSQRNVISPAARKQFLKDLENQEKLQEFLSYVGGVCNGSKVAIELIALAIEIWESYVNLSKHRQVSYKDILSNGKSYAAENVSRIYHSEAYKFINLRFSGEFHARQYLTLAPALQNFLAYYYTTIWLVICQFFQNPYFVKSEPEQSLERGQEGDHKRSLYEVSFEDDFLLQEDSADLFRLSPYKRIKE